MCIPNRHVFQSEKIVDLEIRLLIRFTSRCRSRVRAYIRMQMLACSRVIFAGVPRNSDVHICIMYICTGIAHTEARFPSSLRCASNSCVRLYLIGRFACAATGCPSLSLTLFLLHLLDFSRFIPQRAGSSGPFQSSGELLFISLKITPPRRAAPRSRIAHLQKARFAYYE